MDLSLQNLREVPVDDLLQLGKKLKSLDLAKNQLTSLPGKFSSKFFVRGRYFKNLCQTIFPIFPEFHVNYPNHDLMTKC